MIVWVIGRGGLLGTALASRLQVESAHGIAEYRPGAVPWHDAQEARRVLREQARGLEQHARTGPWTVIWAAGAATTSTSRDQALSELAPLEGLLDGLRSALPPGPGAFFLTSSAGGVYAGSENPPFSTSSAPVPLSAYGELKLAQEAMAIDMLGTQCPVVIGRISNLYGPGQDLTKLQGIISRLALSAVTRQPTNIFVPLDTIRDYLFTADAARAVLDVTRVAAAEQEHQLEVIASGQPATIGQVLRTMDQVTKRRVPVALGTHPSSSAQALDLRMEPSVALEELTPLPVGMEAVYLDLVQRTQSAPLAQ